MAPIVPQRSLSPNRSMGRGFASVDPERQREVPLSYRVREDVPARAGEVLRGRPQQRPAGLYGANGR